MFGLMQRTLPLRLYNTLSRSVEEFKELTSGHVGIYVCGPTVYSDPHLGHARVAVVFDVLRRLLTYIGYQVKFVSNVTDVGHLEGDADEGEDKVERSARVARLHPVELATHYWRVYRRCMDLLNVLPPDIEPLASGHIPEQIELVEAILRRGFAYEVNGSVYFDVPGYSRRYIYGELSGRHLDQQKAVTRTLHGTEEKHHPADFALWKRATPRRLMKWRSPWGVGFPGWHLECSAMSTKYLGLPFDIHGGGLDLIFPHHECEIMQAKAAWDQPPVRYWVHNHLITIDGQKMSKSLGNFITLPELFEKGHPRLSRTYHPMVVRLLLLQTHYRNVIDFSDHALQAAENAYYRLQRLWLVCQHLPTPPTDNPTLHDRELTSLLQTHIDSAFSALYDDLNTAIALAHIFELAPAVFRLQESGTHLIPAQTLTNLQQHLKILLVDILGIKLEIQSTSNTLLTPLIELLIEVRQHARLKKDYQTADHIRERLRQLGIHLQDTPTGTRWEQHLPPQ